MLSVVIPLYNKSQSVERTIRCVQKQTYQDFEVVVVDGYSSDGSLEIIQRLSAEDTRIKVYMQENRHGVTPARNECVQHSVSEHIVFLDADDIWEPTYLERLYSLICDYPDASIWGMAYATMIGKVKTRNSKISTGVYKGFRGLLPSNPWREYGCPYWTSATAVSKTAFNRVWGFDNKIIYGEDIDLWYRLMLNFPAAFDSTETLAFYRLDAENRACNHTFPLEIHIPYHIDKYQTYRENNADFRCFFDRQMLYRLFPYAGDKKYKTELKQILNQIDFSLQKKSMYWRFRLPRLYRLWLRCKKQETVALQPYEGGR